MNWEKLASNIASLAPGIGAAVGGPVGAVAGLGIKTICGFFGIDPESEGLEGQVELALNSMTPAQAVELKKLDLAFQKDMKALDVDVFKLEVADRDSARNREEKVGSRETAIIAYMTVFAFLGVICFILWAIFCGKGLNGIGEMAAGLIGLLVGHLSTKSDQVYSYFFGSSMGSKQKTGALEASVVKAIGGKK